MSASSSTSPSPSSPSSPPSMSLEPDAKRQTSNVTERLPSPKPLFIRELVARLTTLAKDARHLFRQHFYRVQDYAMHPEETEPLSEVALSMKTSFILSAVVDFVDTKVQRNEGGRLQAAASVVDFVGDQDMSKFRHAGRDAIEYGMTRPQVCVREWRDTHRPARVVRASGESTSHSGDGVLKPNFVIYSFHVSPASGSEPLVTQAVCLVAEHKVDSAAEAEAKSRQGFAQHFLQLASAFEALNTPFGYVMVNTRYSRVLMLGPGRFAVEAKPGAEAKEQPASPSIVRAIDFLRSGTIFRSLPHDAVDDAAGELEGLQPLWDLVLASLELLFQLPYNKPLPKLPDPASGSVGNTYDQVRSAVERHHQQARIIRPEDVEACGRNDNNGSQDLPRPGPSAGVLNDSAGAKDCRGDYTDASSIQALASLASDVTSSGVGEVPEDRSNSQCLPDNDALDDLLPFDGDAETYEEEYGCTQVIEQLGFSVALVSSTEMDSMIQEYVAFSRIVRTGTTTQDATPV